MLANDEPLEVVSVCARAYSHITSLPQASQSTRNARDMDNAVAGAGARTSRHIGRVRNCLVRHKGRVGRSKLSWKRRAEGGKVVKECTTTGQMLKEKTTVV